MLTHRRGHVLRGIHQQLEEAVVGRRVGVAPKVNGLVYVEVRVDIHAVRATTDLAGVARAGHIADAGTVGVVFRAVTAPALFWSERRNFGGKRVTLEVSKGLCVVVARVACGALCTMKNGMTTVGVAVVAPPGIGREKKDLICIHEGRMWQPFQPSFVSSMQSVLVGLN